MLNPNCRFVGLLVLLLLSASALAADRQWEQIYASKPFIGENGKKYRPSCSGGPVPGPPGHIQPADRSFSFFFREGDPRKLAIAMDGGGACWDPNTCIGSALVGRPTYSLVVDETPAQLNAGITNIDDPRNPLAAYTQVFIPYCSGDVHWGSKDTLYHLPLPGGSTLPWLIHHRGYDNVAAVLHWLRSYYRDVVGRAPSQAVLAGFSAGGYGALFAFPALKKMLPASTKTFLLADAANGILTEDFYQRALGGRAVSGGVWGIEENVPRVLEASLASGVHVLPIAVYTTLAFRYPDTRLGQYTTAWDQVQVVVFNTMKHTDFPERWLDPVYLQPSFPEWSLKARLAMNLSALAPNYRYYVGAGTEHTALPRDRFYTEQSAQGVKLRDWLDDMLHNRSPRRAGSDWQNVSCTPRCDPPSLLQ